ncbi:MAG: DUF202 domain-containing protein [Balneolales bacterium]
MLRRIVKKKNRFDYKGEIILRDHLALDRTRLANERTLLSYIRTSLYFVIGGIAFLQVEGLFRLQWLGPVCFAFSFFMLITGIYKYLEMRKILNRYYEQ